MSHETLDHPPLAHLRERHAPITIEHCKVLALSALGGMLEYYEFTIFIFLSPYISQLFFPASVAPWLRELQVLTIFGAGYLTRPFGGIVLASLGDKIGRRRMFAISVLLMAAPTLVIGLLPTYASTGAWAPATLLLCRLVQGIALGGELPGAMTFVSEHVPERRLGIAFGIVGSSVTLGFIAASAVIGVVTAHSNSAELLRTGWRIPFLLGGAFGLVSAFLRRYVSETPVFREMSAHHKLTRGSPFALLLRDQRRETILCVLLSIAPGVMISGVQLFPSIYLQMFLHYDPSIVHHAQLWLMAAMFAGGFIGGFVVDAIGWVKAIIGTMILLIVTLFLFYGFTTPETVTGWFIAIGLFLSCMVMLYNPLVYSFRAQTRLTGIATVYNISAAVFGGTTPVLMQLMAHFNKWGLAIYPALAGIITLVVTPMLWQLRKPLFAE
jgi:MFS family permease